MITETLEGLRVFTWSCKPMNLKASMLNLNCLMWPRGWIITLESTVHLNSKGKKQNVIMDDSVIVNHHHPNTGDGWVDVKHWVAFRMSFRRVQLCFHQAVHVGTVNPIWI